MFFITTLAPGKPVVKLSAIASPEMGWPGVRGGFQENCTGGDMNQPPEMCSKPLPSIV